MNSLLDEKSTWFFDGLCHGLDKSLVIDLVEGIKATQSQMVDVGAGEPMGPYFAIKVLPESQCVRVKFDEAHLFFVCNESFDVGDDSLEAEDGVLRKLSASLFQKYILNSTGISSVLEDGFDCYLLWTEDRLFYVACTGIPSVSLRDVSPDFSIKRTSTWSAS